MVVLIQVLADEINVGYHDCGNNVMTSVNGENSSTMKDLVHAFEENNGKYHVMIDDKG